MDSAVPTFKLGYRGAERRITVRLIGQWRRGECHMVMSTSSGPKDYLKNQMAAILEAPNVIEEIRMYCGEYKTSIPFCVFRVGSRWFDSTLLQVKSESPAKEVVIV